MLSFIAGTPITYLKELIYGQSKFWHFVVSWSIYIQNMYIIPPVKKSKVILSLFSIVNIPLCSGICSDIVVTVNVPGFQFFSRFLHYLKENCTKCSILFSQEKYILWEIFSLSLSEWASKTKRLCSWEFGYSLWMWEWASKWFFSFLT